jgi:hypothetical protein
LPELVPVVRSAPNLATNASVPPRLGRGNGVELVTVFAGIVVMLLDVVEPVMYVLAVLEGSVAMPYAISSPLPPKYVSN